MTSMFQNRMAITLFAVACLTAAFYGGCTKTIDGEAYENQPPVVWFVNVPPENTRSSINPIVNWVGQDPDGQIDYYRYIVVREDVMATEMGIGSWSPGIQLQASQVQAYIDDNLDLIADSLWTTLLVRADSVDPRTSNIVPMSAHVDDPVRSFVSQYVIVQAFDELGLGSVKIFRRFLRNDNPPDTRIVGWIDIPFINSVEPSGPNTGIRVNWRGSDVTDYPADAPPFEYEWRLLGPYTDTEYEDLIAAYEKTVFITHDAQVLRFGQPWDTVKVDTVVDTVVDDQVFPPDTTFDTTIQHTIIQAFHERCDTTWPGGMMQVVCDTLAIDQVEPAELAPYGVIDTLLEVWSDEFENSVFYTNKVADSSYNPATADVWVGDEYDSIYDVYRNAPSTETQTATFLFVVRSRDDALVPDPTPSYQDMSVFDPKHERDILVIIWNNSADEQQAKFSDVGAYWETAINTWSTETGRDIDFTIADDFSRHGDGSYTQGFNLLSRILKYKVAIMLQDAAVSGSWSGGGIPVINTTIALQSGVNVWVASRVPIGNHPYLSQYAGETADSLYRYFFGVEQTVYSGWSYPLLFTDPNYRIEHFVGALSLDQNKWPDLAVDTARLHGMYKWVTGEYGWASPNGAILGAIPEVNWCVRSFETEAMYLFKSLYGAQHALENRLSYHGRPVAIRLDRAPLFRTVHWMFTPMALKQAAAQQTVNDVLSWLYDGRVDLSSSSSGRTSQSAAMSENLKSIYWDCYWKAEGDVDRFYELLSNASYR